MVDSSADVVTTGRSKIFTLTSTEYGNRICVCRVTIFAGPLSLPMLDDGSVTERPLTVILTEDPGGWFRGTMPETDLFPRSRMSQSALGKVSMDSTSSSLVLSNGLKSMNIISDWKTSTLTWLVNTWILARIVYVSPVARPVAMRVMLTSDSVKLSGTVPIKAGGGEGLILTQSTGGLVVICKASSSFRRKSVRLIW